MANKNGAYGAFAVDVNGRNGKEEELLPPQYHPKAHNSVGSTASAAWQRENPDLGDGGFRAFVLAFMDGFVTTLCFVLSIGTATESLVLFAGMVSAMAGIFSMAIGEWISMQLQNDGLELELKALRKYTTRTPDGAADHLKAVLLEKYNFSAKTVDSMLHDLKQSTEYKERMIDFWSRVDLGIDPDELGGKPWKAVIMCALGYGAGAIVPLASWYFGALWGEGFSGCVGLSFIMTIVVGGVLANFTANHWAYTIMRQVVVTFLAAGAVYLMSQFTPQGF
mmetsp:Transcript_20903/g.51226  ORF Transcript_20903/g.51226 Transcript_20903/m.51226 type:complete len:279 (+) Transcript_20903:166-1002(+)|eukprot:CAMPEP_0114513156 /NCGR_PEP_ID=MMETSP0109-20121206/15400_1 /TAXON_ID=29199 /ORGANISM="Chlorarachnion reptans, Strain CCCM449" /LENGTH=278 /DNA_ID=CAMNT_0001692971 /DNA_START=287 /DNA_END=1123 /DNA_ORIENTATION=-